MYAWNLFLKNSTLFPSLNPLPQPKSDHLISCILITTVSCSCCLCLWWNKRRKDAGWSQPVQLHWLEWKQANRLCRYRPNHAGNRHWFFIQKMLCSKCGELLHLWLRWKMRSRSNSENSCEVTVPKERTTMSNLRINRKWDSRPCCCQVLQLTNWVWTLNCPFTQRLLSNVKQCHNPNHRYQNKLRKPICLRFCHRYTFRVVSTWKMYAGSCSSTTTKHHGTTEKKIFCWRGRNFKKSC